MTARERAKRLIKTWPKVYPNAHCELDFRNPLQLLVATILSAQSTDKRVNVDTHVARLSQRLGLTKHKDPVKIELDLMKLVPREHWTNWSHWLIWHGRRRCFARKPDCGQCEVLGLCPTGKIFLRTGQAKQSD